MTKTLNGNPSSAQINDLLISDYTTYSSNKIQSLTTSTITNLTADIIPSITNTYDLGSDSYKFNELYVTNANMSTIGNNNILLNIASGVGANITVEETCTSIKPVSNTSTIDIGADAYRFDGGYFKNLFATEALEAGQLYASYSFTTTNETFDLIASNLYSGGYIKLFEFGNTSITVSADLICTNITSDIITSDSITSTYFSSTYLSSTDFTCSTATISNLSGNTAIITTLSGVNSLTVTNLTVGNPITSLSVTNLTVGNPINSLTVTNLTVGNPINSLTVTNLTVGNPINSLTVTNLYATTRFGDYIEVQGSDTIVTTSSTSFATKNVASIAFTNKATSSNFASGALSLSVTYSGPQISTQIQFEIMSVSNSSSAFSQYAIFKNSTMLIVNYTQFSGTGLLTTTCTLANNDVISPQYALFDIGTSSYRRPKITIKQI